MSVQTVSKLQLLATYLLQSLTPAIKANDIDAWQERGQLILSGEDLGEGVRVAKWRHNATILIERFPQNRIQPYTVLAMVAAWAIEHDQDREQWDLADPDIDIDIVSDDQCVLIIDVELMDDIELVPATDGPILFMGTRYRVAMVPINVAETVTVEERRV